MYLYFEMVHENSYITFFLILSRNAKVQKFIFRRISFLYSSNLFILECPKGTRKPEEIVNTSLSFHQKFTQCHAYYESFYSSYFLANVAYWTNATMIFTIILNKRSLY